MDLKSLAMICACAALIASVASMDQQVDFDNSFLFSKKSASVQKSLEVAAIYDSAQQDKTMRLAQSDLTESLANIAPAAGGQDGDEARVPNFTPFGKTSFDNKHSWMYGGAPQ